METNTRHTVIDCAVVFEDRINITLSMLLGITNIENTKSFGFGSSSLSFNSKLNLLLDLDSISKDEKKKFEYFSQIRNQFAHNLSITNFSECFDKITGLENALLKSYPPISTLQKPREDKLKECFNTLIVDLFVSFAKLYDKVGNISYKKGELEGKLDGQNLLIESLLESIKEIASIIPNGHLIQQAILTRSVERFKDKK